MALAHPFSNRRGPAATLAAWRIHPSVVDWVTGFEQGGRIAPILLSDLIASGVPAQVVRSWMAQEGEDDPNEQLPPSDPTWLAMTLTTLSWHHPSMEVQVGALWGLVVAAAGADLLSTTSDWEPVGLDRAWVYLAAGMTPREVLDDRDATGVWPDVQAARTVAGLRGVHLPDV